MIGALLKDVGGLVLYGLGPRWLAPSQSLWPLAKRIGDLARLSNPTDARILQDEIATTVALDDPGAVARKAWRLRALIELEVLRYPQLSPDTIDAVAVLEGEEHLRAARADGRGAVVMIGHFGANQLIMPALGWRGYPMNQLSSSPLAWAEIRTDGRVNPLWLRVQQRRWALEQTLPTEHIDVFGFLRPAYQALQRGEVLGLAFDGGGGTRWMPVPLGRREAWVSTQPWQLARSTGARIVPTVVIWDGERHRVVMDEPFEVSTSGKKLDDIREAATRYAEWFSRWVERHPDHYAPYLLLRHRVRDSDAKPFFATDRAVTGQP